MVLINFKVLINFFIFSPLLEIKIEYVPKQGESLVEFNIHAPFKFHTLAMPLTEINPQL